jgi:hypothetical protein
VVVHDVVLCSQNNNMVSVMLMPTTSNKRAADGFLIA